MKFIKNEHHNNTMRNKKLTLREKLELIHKKGVEFAKKKGLKEEDVVDIIHRRRKLDRL